MFEQIAIDRFLVGCLDPRHSASAATGAGRRCRPPRLARIRFANRLCRRSRRRIGDARVARVSRGAPGDVLPLSVARWYPPLPRASPRTLITPQRAGAVCDEVCISGCRLARMTGARTWTGLGAQDPARSAQQALHMSTRALVAGHKLIDELLHAPRTTTFSFSPAIFPSDPPRTASPRHGR